MGEADDLDDDEHPQQEQEAEDAAGIHIKQSSIIVLDDCIQWHTCTVS